MKKTLSIVAIVMGICIFFSGCGVFFMVAYSIGFKPRETWYFSRGFDKKLSQTRCTILIADSTNISDKAIPLVRMNKNTTETYWVDFEPGFFDENNIRLRIIDSNGYIARYLDGWLEPETTSPFEINNMSLSQDKKGNLIINNLGTKHRLHHMGDMMGPHHFDFEKPKNLKNNTSLNLEWGGMDYSLFWLEYRKKVDGFHLINKYSYNGDIVDSFYIIIPDTIKIVKNHFFYNESYLLNGGKCYTYQNKGKPFGGYGKDEGFVILSSVLHSFKKDSYFTQCLKQIWYGDHIPDFDWLRNKKNLRIVNETIKSIGYSKFLSKEAFQEKKYGIRAEYFINHNLGYSLRDINDSLIYFYEKTNAPIYYREFWERRNKEGIKTVVYDILTSLQRHYIGSELAIQKHYINDTLSTLLNYDLKIQDDNHADTLVSYYNYLNRLGLKQSAYNLMFIDSISDGRGIDKEQLFQQLDPKSRVIIKEGKPHFLTTEIPDWISLEPSPTY